MFNDKDLDWKISQLQELANEKACLQVKVKEREA